MARRAPAKSAGFTLIELIAAIVLLGVLAATAGVGLVQAVEAFVSARAMTELTQEAQMAVTRISLELKSLDDIVTGTTSGTQLTFTSTRRGTADTYRIALDGAGDRVTVTDLSSNVTGVLLDEVANTNGQPLFRYFRVTANGGLIPWIPGTSPMDQLYRIDIDLRAGGLPDSLTSQTLQFTASVNPQNSEIPDAPIPES